MAWISKEISIPASAVGHVIGKGGKTIQMLEKMPGALQVKVVTSGEEKKVIIRGLTAEAVENVASQIEKLVVLSITSSTGYHPDFFVICLSNEAGNSTCPVNFVEFQRIPHRTVTDVFGANEVVEVAENLFYVAETCKSDLSGGPPESGSESPEINSLVVKLMVNSMSSQGRSTSTAYQGAVSYRDHLMGCVSELMGKTCTSQVSVSLLIRFGKQGFYQQAVANCGIRFSMQNLQDLINNRRMHCLFSSFCSEQAIERLNRHLEQDVYERLQGTSKIVVHLVDVDNRTKYTVSMRPEKEEPEDLAARSGEIERILQCTDYFQVLAVAEDTPELQIKKAYRRTVLLVHPDKNHHPAAGVVCRAVNNAYETLMDPRRKADHLKSSRKTLICDTADIPKLKSRPKVTRFQKAKHRYGFVTFVGECKKMDFRLAVQSQDTEGARDRGVLEWLEQAWDNRQAADGLLVFDSGKRFRIVTVRYKETRIYSSDQFKVSVTKVSSADMSNTKTSTKHQVSMKSWWLKEFFKNPKVLGSGSANERAFLSHVDELVGEASKLNRVMGELQWAT